MDGEKKRLLSLDALKFRLDRGFYTRLDHFQSDFFKVLDKARSFAKINSRLYSDTVTLQRKYIELR